MLVSMWEKGNRLTLLVGMQTGAAPLENSMEVPQKVENRTTLRPSDCTTRDLPQRYKCSKKKEHLHPNVYSNNVHNSQTMEKAQMSTDRWIKKMWYTYTMEYYAAIKKWNLAICNNVAGTRGIMLSKTSQSEKDNYHMILLIIWNLRHKAEDHRGKE